MSGAGGKWIGLLRHEGAARRTPEPLKVDPYPLIWTDETMRPHRPDKTRLSPKRRNQWRGWVTHVRIDGNPGIRGTRSLLRQDVQRKPLR